MKIAIIGGGIGGLAAYHALRKYLPQSTTSITIYEAYPSSRSTTTIIGGGLGLQPNGQRATATISPPALSYIQSRSVESPTFTFRNSRGKVLGVMNAGDRKKHGYGTIMAPRATVHEGFLVEGDMEEVVRWGKKVKEVKEFEDRVEMLFEDGERDTCDLLIGADGVRSVCKEALFGKEYPPKYGGLTGIGGFLPLSSLSTTFQSGLRKELVTMTFSRSGFFGYGLCSPSTADNGEERMMWWSTYECDPPLPRDTPPSQVLDHLLARHGDWTSPYDEKDTGRCVFRDIVTLACQDTSNFLVLPRYITPLLPNWSTARTSKGQGRIVLLGDAAHAMPPDSGQGVSCAVEDGLALALLLKHHLSNSRLTQLEAIRKSVIAYEEIRKPRVTRILNFAKRSGDGKREIGWLGEKMRDWGLWIFTRLPSSVLHDGLFGYDVEAEVKKYLKQ
ncbi:FAD/NAD(P)-binding domain-containing protein [Marasmius fiardii PR-910]|nr:FAD/NAD(P)-binding domain-containing protein [Marasmius fiardii PR-910]